MPVVKHGLAFKYFDKAICGVVALALLVGIVFALSRASSATRDGADKEVANVLDHLREELSKPHINPVPQPYIVTIRDHLADVRDPAAVTDIFYMRVPVTYQGLAISTEREFELEFSAPLTKDSIAVSEGAKLVDVLEHPVQGDYKRVRLASRSQQGSVVVEGVGSDGRQHKYPVRVDASVGKTAYAPGLKVASTQKGAVVLNVLPDPRNSQEGVEVTEYEVWRRDWQDPLGAFRKVASADKDAIAASATLLAASPLAAIGPYNAVAQPAAPVGIYWEDRGVVPGLRYSYKVRTVGSNTYPAASEFTDAVFAEVDAELDFRFTSSLSGKVGCDVLKSAGDLTPTKATFWVVAGQEIGGVVRDPIALMDLSYLTGNIMLDLPRTDRMIYADPDGFLRQRSRGEAKAPKNLWDTAVAAGSRAGMVPGAGMFGPGPVGPMR